MVSGRTVEASAVLNKKASSISMTCRGIYWPAMSAQKPPLFVQTPCQRTIISSCKRKSSQKYVFIFFLPSILSCIPPSPYPCYQKPTKGR